MCHTLLSSLVHKLLALLLAGKTVRWRAVGIKYQRFLAQRDALRTGVHRDVLAHELLDVAQVEFFLGRGEGERPAIFARASGASNAVDVVLGVRGHVEVDHICHVGDVDAARQDVGCHQHAHLAVGKAPQRAGTLVLVAVAVDGRALDACLAQAPADGVGAVLSAHKDNHALGALAMQNLYEGVVLGLVRDGQHILVNRLGGCALVRNLDAYGVVDQRLGVVQHVV